MLSMRPYWFVRTLAGISMDIGMTLLVINLMMTALRQPVRAAETPALSARLRSRPVERPDERAIRRPGGRRPVFFLALFTQGFLPFFEPSARTDKVTAVVRTDLGQLKWMLTGPPTTRRSNSAAATCICARVAGTAIRNSCVR